MATNIKPGDLIRTRFATVYLWSQTIKSTNNQISRNELNYGSLGLVIMIDDKLVSSREVNAHEMLALFPGPVLGWLTTIDVEKVTP